MDTDARGLRNINTEAAERAEVTDFNPGYRKDRKGAQGDGGLSDTFLIVFIGVIRWRAGFGSWQRTKQISLRARAEPLLKS